MHTYIPQTWKKHFFVNSETWGVQTWRIKTQIKTNLKLRQNSLNQIFNPNALFFSLLGGTTLYYNAIYIPFTLFASSMGYEDDILEFISNLYAQGTKVGGKRTNFCGKSFKKVNSAEFMEFVFFPV